MPSPIPYLHVKHSAQKSIVRLEEVVYSQCSGQDLVHSECSKNPSCGHHQALYREWASKDDGSQSSFPPVSSLLPA